MTARHLIGEIQFGETLTYVSESYDAAPFVKSEHMNALSKKDNR